MHINVYKYLTYVDYDFKLGKSVRVHHGITAVLRRDVPGPYRHCKKGASIRNLKPLAIFLWLYSSVCVRSGRKLRKQIFIRRGSIDTDTDRTNAIAQETKMKALIGDYGC